MSNTPRNMHSEASLNRRLVLFATQLEGYLAHFPHCHKYTITQGIRQALDVCEGVVFVPKAVVDLVAIHAKNFCCLGHSHSLSIDFDQSICPAISALLFGANPPAISGFIVAFVVNSVNRQPSRPPTHVGKEIGKDHPSITNGNPAPAVIGKAFVLRARAPFNHPAPNAVFGFVCGGAAWRQSSCRSRCCSLRPKAPTRRCISISQINARHNAHPSAIAGAPPASPSRGGFLRNFNNGKTPKLLPGQVDQLRHCSRL